MDQTSDEDADKMSHPAAGSDYSGEFAEKGQNSDGCGKRKLPRLKSRQYDECGVLKPRHATEGVLDAVYEHKDELTNPSHETGNATGAGPNRPKSPSNSS